MIKNVFSSCISPIFVVLRVSLSLMVIIGPLLALPALSAGDETIKKRGGGAVLLASIQRGRL